MNEAPEIRFAFYKMFFRAVIISMMRTYLSKNSHTHLMKIDQTKMHAMHLHAMSVHVMAYVFFSFHVMNFFFRER